MAKSSKRVTSKSHYEEWMVEIKGPATARYYEKVKLIRPRVLLPDAMAETLNEGVLNMDVVNNNRLPLFYIKIEPKTETV